MFIPIGDDNSTRKNFPVVTWLIFAVNCFVWFLELKLGEKFIYGYSAIPYEILNRIDLASAQTITSGGHEVILEHAKGPTPIYLTILSSMFMHGSWMHIIGNMMYLLIFGDQIEDLLGRFRFLFFYLACGVIASLAHIFASPESTIPSLGASGAIAGVLGAYLIKYPGNKVRVLVGRQMTLLPASIVLLGWIALQFFSQAQLSATGASDGVAYMAHIGGFIAGVILVFVFRLGRA